MLKRLHTSMKSTVQTIVEEYIKRHLFEVGLVLISVLYAIIVFINGIFALQRDQIIVLSDAVVFPAYNMLIAGLVVFALSGKRFRLSKLLPLIIIVGMTLIIISPWGLSLFSGDLIRGTIDAVNVLMGFPDPTNPEGIIPGLHQNPYIIPGVRHWNAEATGLFSPETHFRWTTYAFLPIDLLCYSFLLAPFRERITPGPPFFGGVQLFPYAFILANVLLVVVSTILGALAIPGKRSDRLVMAFALSYPFIWNNSILAYAFFAASLLLFQRGKRRFALIPLALSALSKYFAAIFVFPLAISYLKRREWKEAVLAIMIPFALFLIVCIPFDILAVLKSTLFFYTSSERLYDGSMQGAFLTDMLVSLGFGNYVTLLIIGGFLIILIISIFLLKDETTQFLFWGSASILFMSGNELQFVPFLILLALACGRINLGDQSHAEIAKKKWHDLFSDDAKESREQNNE